MSARKVLVLNSGLQEQVQTTDHLDLSVFVAGLGTGANLLGVSGKAWANSVDMWLKVGGDTATPTIVDAVTGGSLAPGGKVHEFVNASTGGSLYAIDQFISVNQYTTYYGRIWAARTAGSSPCYFGCVCYDKDSVAITGTNGGTHVYFIASNVNPSATGSWYYGNINSAQSGNASAFPPGTKYIRPLIIINNGGTGTVQISNFEISDRPFMQTKGDKSEILNGSRDFVRSTYPIGTVATNGTTTLTGTDTQFTKIFKVGDTITVSGETIRTIASITSDTVLDSTVAFSTTASSLAFVTSGGTQFSLLPNGNFGIGVTNPKAAIELRSGTTTSAPAKLNSGSLLTTIVQYALEMLSGIIYFSPTTTVRQFFLMNGYVQITANYTVVSGITKIGVTSLSVSRVVTLMAANSVPAGFEITITDESGLATGVTTITITAAGSDTVNGGNTITTGYGSRTIYSDGVSKWFNK